MAKLNSLLGRHFESYEDTGKEVSAEITLSATPGTVTSVVLPTTAKGIKLYPRSNHIRFSINTSTAAVATVAANDQTVVAADLAVGGIAKADLWEIRLLPAYKDAARTLYLRSTTASVVVDLEVF